ncbi:hypothetical protein AMECASPLE_028653 [Ameca splendens]|uniref:Uncharacterized protein n=1 Tax=Ameca splendens TaxID=208324 RepID=A0ABV0Z4B9_9TELE
MQSRMFEFETTCSVLIKENEMLRIKTDDLEDRSRCNNFRITILLEKAEGSRPTVFITECLTEFWIRSVCHTARVLKYQNKMLILKLAQETDHLIYRDMEVHIFPFYSLDVSKRKVPA